MAENNKTCSICGKGYYYCKVCNSTKATPWKYMTDTSEHFKIHQIIKGYTSGVFTKAEAKKKLKEVDLTGMETFIPEVKTILEEIIGISTVGHETPIMDEPIEVAEVENTVNEEEPVQAEEVTEGDENAKQEKPKKKKK